MSRHNPFLDGPHAPRHSMITVTNLQQIQDIISSYTNYGYAIRYSPPTEKDDADMLLTYASYEQLFPCLIFILIRSDYALFKDICKLYGVSIYPLQITNPALLCYDHKQPELIVSGKYNDIICILKKYNMLISNKMNYIPEYNIYSDISCKLPHKKDLCRVYGLSIPKILQYNGNINIDNYKTVVNKNNNTNNNRQPLLLLPHHPSEEYPEQQSVSQPLAIIPSSSKFNTSLPERDHCSNMANNNNNRDTTTLISAPVGVQPVRQPVSHLNIKREPMPYADIPENQLTEMQKAIQLRYIEYWQDKDEEIATYRAQANINHIDNKKNMTSSISTPHHEEKEKQRILQKYQEKKQDGYKIRLQNEHDKLRRLKEEEIRKKQLDIIRIQKEKERDEHEKRLQTFRNNKEQLERERILERQRRQNNFRYNNNNNNYDHNRYYYDDSDSY